ARAPLGPRRLAAPALAGPEDAGGRGGRPARPADQGPPPERPPARRALGRVPQPAPQPGAAGPSAVLRPGLDGSARFAVAGGAGRPGGAVPAAAPELAVRRPAAGAAPLGVPSAPARRRDRPARHGRAGGVANVLPRPPGLDAPRRRRADPGAPV